MKRLLVLVIVAALLLTGYLTYQLVFEGRVPEGREQLYPSVPQAMPAATQALVKESSQQVSVQYSQLRNVTISVYVRLQVSDVNSAYYRLSEVASRYGGYVQGSSVYEGGGYLTLRVPAARLESALSEVKSVGKVEREERNVEDVTEQVMDTETRLRNLRATESRLLELLNRAESVSDIIEIEDKLSQIRQQIEWLEAARRNLQLMVNYATISVELRKAGYVAPEEDPLNRIWDDARKAFIGSLYLLVVGIAFLALPLSLIVVAYLTYGKLRSLRNRGTKQVPQ